MPLFVLCRLCSPIYKNSCFLMFGRTVHEPMTDLAILLGKLVAPDGTILVPGVDNMIKAADSEERYEIGTQLPTISG